MNDFDRVKERLRIEEVARRLGLEIKRGRARCFNTPGHKNGDRKPSLSFDLRRQSFKCWACGVHGDIFDLYQGYTRENGKEALRALESWAGIGQEPAIKPRISQEARSEGEKPPANTKRDGRDFSGLYEAFKDFCGGVDPEALEYLTGKKRGLTRKTVGRFGIFSLPEYKKAKEFLLSLASLEDLKRAGLAFGNGRLVFSQHKIIIPFFDRGRVVFLQGRSARDYEHLGKYQGLDDISPPLFNTDTLESMKPGERVFLCEGAFDAMSLEQIGEKAVGVLGAGSFRPEFVDLFNGLSVTILFDRDQSGQEGAERVKRVFNERGRGVFISDLWKKGKFPAWVKDITDFLRYRREKASLKSL